jgi:hypothetical protein
MLRVWDLSKIGGTMELSIRRTTSDGIVVCFKHAVLRAIEGEDISEEVDVFNQSDNDFRSTTCQDCHPVTMEDIEEETYIPKESIPTRSAVHKDVIRGGSPVLSKESLDRINAAREEIKQKKKEE